LRVRYLQARGLRHHCMRPRSLRASALFRLSVAFPVMLVCTLYGLLLVCPIVKKMSPVLYWALLVGGISAECAILVLILLVTLKDPGIICRGGSSLLLRVEEAHPEPAGRIHCPQCGALRVDHRSGLDTGAYVPENHF
jgi:hypothetical protein